MVVGLLGGKGYASSLQVAHPTRDTVNSATNARTDFNMTYEQLLELDFDELMALADKYGVSLDELMQMPFDVQTSSASKKEESVFDSPLSISVLTKEQIRLSGATSIPELLRRIPGVIVREQTPGVFDLHLRGLDNVPPRKFSHFANNSLTLVMVDGIPYYNYTMGGTFWESLPVSLGEIEHIDIIRGASSALYGASAVSGVVNIVTGNTSNQLTATADARTYLQDMKFGAHLVGHVQVPLYKQLRLAVSQSYTLRRVNNYDAYSFANGRYEPYAGLTGLSGRPYYNPGEFIGISTSALLFNGMRSMDAHVVSAQLDYMGYKFKRKRAGWLPARQYKGCLHGKLRDALCHSLPGIGLCPSPFVLLWRAHPSRLLGRGQRHGHHPATPYLKVQLPAGIRQRGLRLPPIRPADRAAHALVPPCRLR